MVQQKEVVDLLKKAQNDLAAQLDVLADSSDDQGNTLGGGAPGGERGPGGGERCDVEAIRVEVVDEGVKGRRI